MHAVQKIALVVCVGLLSACADMGGIHATAQPKPLSQLRLSAGLVLASLQHGAKPQADWWRALGDAQLNALMDAALAHNPDLALARARRAQAAGLSAVAGAPLLPQANLDGQVGRAHWTENQFFPPPFGGSTTWDNALNLSASYSLDLWGQHRAAALAAQDRVGVSRAERAAAQLLLSSELVCRYVRYAADAALQDAWRALAANAAQAVRIEQIRLAHGLTNAQSLHQAEALAARIQENLAKLHGDKQLRALQIAVLTGSGTATQTPLQRPSLPIDAAWRVPEKVPIDLLGLRPDVAARRGQVSAAGEDVTVARAAFYPNVNLAAYVGGLAASGGFLEFLKLGSAHYGVTPALTLPIFDGGRLRGNLQAQTGAYDEAVARYNQALLTALKQTATALTALRTLAEQRTALDSQHQIAKANAALAQQRFAAGLSNRLPLLQAERSVLQLQIERTELNASAIEQLTLLFAALGGTVLPDTLKTYTTIEFSPLSPARPIKGKGESGFCVSILFSTGAFS